MTAKRLYRVTAESGSTIHYQTRRAAEHRRAVLADFGVDAWIEESEPITWPIPPTSKD